MSFQDTSKFKAGFEDDDCEDQGGMAKDVCVKFECDNSLLELRGRNWCCSNCGSSYGEDARGVIPSQDGAK